MEIDKEIVTLYDLVAVISKKKVSEEEIAEKARQFKARLVDNWQQMSRHLSIVDGLVKEFAPHQPWQAGLVLNPFPMPPTPQPKTTLPPKVTVARRVSKSDDVLRISKEISSKEGVVTSKQIAARLRAEGDTRSDKALETSVSNILNRQGWRKVHPGEYRLVEAENKDKNNESVGVSS